MNSNKQTIKGGYLFSPEEAAHALPSSGVNRKVHAQVEALNCYVQCTLFELPPIHYQNSKIEKIIRRVPGTAVWRKWKYTGEYHDLDFLYIRQVYHDASFIRYLKAIKKDNPRIKLIYEIPTFPFDPEGAITASNFAFVLKEKVNQKKLSKYIDRIVTFYGQNEILGIPCLDLINGFDFSKVIVPTRSMTEQIHIMSVAMTAFWHGYDRVIEGLYRYYASGGTENIIYHLCGIELPSLRELVKKYNLEDHVVFHGVISGSELEKVYQISFLGLDVLGGHRKNYPISSSLKSREYAANGLPIITSSPVDYLQNDYPFQFIAPYDDSPLNMEEVLSFYHRIYDKMDCNQVSKTIRDYAEPRCDMKYTMKPVADWLLSY